jgi:hypothetical protein
MAIGGLANSLGASGFIQGLSDQSLRHLGLFAKKFSCPSETFFDSEEIPRLYPDIWMPLRYALAMYWRVKKWRFSYSMAWQEESELFWQYSTSAEFFVGQFRRRFQSQGIISSEPRVNGPIVTLVDDTFGEPLEKEKKLVCGADPIEGEILVEPDFGEPFLEAFVIDRHFECALSALPIQSNPPGGGTRVGAEVLYPYNQPPAFYKMGPTGLEFRPAIFFSASTFRWVSIHASNWTSTQQPPSGPYGTFSYKLLGQTFSTDIYAYNSRGGTTLNVTAELEAVEYWPYDPQDGGGPIYDSVTGERIRFDV